MTTNKLVIILIFILVAAGCVDEKSFVSASDDIFISIRIKDNHRAWIEVKNMSAEVAMIPSKITEESGGSVCSRYLSVLFADQNKDPIIMPSSYYDHSKTGFFNHIVKSRPVILFIYESLSPYNSIESLVDIEPTIKEFRRLINVHRIIVGIKYIKIRFRLTINHEMVEVQTDWIKYDI